MRNLDQQEIGFAPDLLHLDFAQTQTISESLVLLKGLFKLFKNHFGLTSLKTDPSKLRSKILKALPVLKKMDTILPSLGKPVTPFEGVDDLSTFISESLKKTSEADRSDLPQKGSEEEFEIELLQEFKLIQHNNEDDQSLMAHEKSTAAITCQSLGKNQLTIKEAQRLRYQATLRTLTVQLATPFDQRQIKFSQEFLGLKGAQVTFVEPSLLTIRFRGDDINRFTKKYGYLETLHRRLQLTPGFAVLPSLESDSSQGDTELVKDASSFFRLTKQGYLPSGEIRKYLMRRIHSEKQIPLVRKIISKIKRKCKQSSVRERKRNSQRDVQIYDNENLFKAKIETADGSLYCYYSERVMNYIRSNCFDQLFVDGTHFKALRRSQLVIVRVASEQLNKVVTCLYCLAPSKKSEVYKSIFVLLESLGVLKGIKIVMSDFELAIRKGFRLSTAHPVTFRFCFFHFQSALRKFANSINKQVSLQNSERQTWHQRTTPHIHRVFSFLIFVPKSLQAIAFRLFKFVFRQVESGLSNELFFDYFERAYLNGVFFESFFIDLAESKIVTNNFVEGLNSSLKRHSRGRITISFLLDWLKISSKSEIASLSEASKAQFQTNENFTSFQQRIMQGQNFWEPIIEYISVTKRGREKSDYLCTASTKVSSLLRIEEVLKNLEVVQFSTEKLQVRYCQSPFSIEQEPQSRKERSKRFGALFADYEHLQARLSYR